MPKVCGVMVVTCGTTKFKGAHFALYGAIDSEAGQHYFRWLNPLELRSLRPYHPSQG